MSKNLPVTALKQGDRFEFNSNPAEGAKSTVMVVTRDPSVNLAANSCHFRYQPDGAAADGNRKWDENQSWNGTPDVKVRLLDKVEAVEVAAVAEPAESEESETPVKKTPRKKKPA